MASISDINRIGLNSITSLIGNENDVNYPGSGEFGELLDKALSGVQLTDAEDKLANLGLLTGEVTDLHTAILAGEKAELTLRLTTQLRNKVVEAYNEIMRMQV